MIAGTMSTSAVAMTASAITISAAVPTKAQKRRNPVMTPGYPGDPDAGAPRMRGRTLGAMDATLIRHLDDDAEVEISTTKQDGTAVTTTIWSVVVDGTAYVRSVRGRRGAWYRRALARDGSGFSIDGAVHPVHLVPVDDEQTLAAVDAALETKYRARWSSSTDAMLTDEARPCTLRVAD